METLEKNYNDLKELTLIVTWITGFCSCCLMCIYQPFMKIWIGEENIFPISCVVCFVIYFFFRCVNQLFIVYKDAAGMWHEDRFRPLATALTNLILNLILVQIIGIYGVLLSTVISTLVVGMPWLLNNIFTVIFHVKMGEFLRNFVFYIGVTCINVLLTYMACEAIPVGGIMCIVVRLILCCIIPNAFYLLAYRQKKEFKQAVMLMDKILGSKVHFLHKILIKLL